MSFTTVGANVPQFIGDITLDPSSVPAWKYQTETFTVAGLTTDMVVTVKAPSLEAGLVLLGSQCLATGVLTLTFSNQTSAAVNPASQAFKIIGH